MIELLNKIFQVLKNIALDNGDILWIDIWNEQTKEEEDYPLFLPAVFVEFQEVEYKTIKNFIQKGDVLLVLHICQNHTGVDTHEGAYNQSLRFLELLQKVYVACQGLGGVYFSPLERKKLVKSEKMNTQIIYEMTFSTNITDEDKLLDYNSQFVLIEPDIQPEKI